MFIQNIYRRSQLVYLILLILSCVGRNLNGTNIMISWKISSLHLTFINKALVKLKEYKNIIFPNPLGAVSTLIAGHKALCNNPFSNSSPVYLVKLQIIISNSLGQILDAYQ